MKNVEWNSVEQVKHEVNDAKRSVNDGQRDNEIEHERCPNGRNTGATEIVNAIENEGGIGPYNSDRCPAYGLEDGPPSIAHDEIRKHRNHHGEGSASTSAQLRSDEQTSDRYWLNVRQWLHHDPKQRNAQDKCSHQHQIVD